MPQPHTIASRALKLAETIKFGFWLSRHLETPSSGSSGAFGEIGLFLFRGSWGFCTTPKNDVVFL
jgi:hypothetical protein